MSTELHPARGRLMEDIRRTMIGLLNQQLADGLDLGMQSRQAHWNVNGPDFVALHELFGGVSHALLGLVNDLAERAVALGGTAEGTIQALAGASRIAPYPAHLQSGRRHLEALSRALAQYALSTRAAIKAADRLKDPDTVDLLTGILLRIDSLLRLLDGHGTAREGQIFSTLRTPHA
ncbi:MAG: starvation/stationary phase protection protein Dps [Verrucomicrobiaceae bacterium]|nr:starvation/stationary phase protection protein Dps [Verrucomicrobiaceae bacterium]